MRLLLGDCIDKLKELEDNSIDSIVTDPPYGLSFMGKDWDKKKATQETKSQVVKGLGAGMKMTTLADNIEFEKWVTEWASECMRVLKPGGYMLAFGGSRMYHRLASGVENAGFEIRDQMMWVYGSGFPKSLNIGKGVDKKLGNERELVERPKSEQRPNADNNRDKNKDIGGFAMSDNKYKSVGNSEWEGWGTALKPAHEPIVMARKPLSEKTVVDNVLEWGTGGINIEDSRIPSDYSDSERRTSKTGVGIWNKGTRPAKEEGEERHNPNGRFPANIIFDEEAGKILDEQTGILKSGNLNAGHKRGVGTGNSYANGGGGGIIDRNYGGDEGGASRFFYCPKTSKTDRNEGLDGFEEKRKSHITSQNFENALTGAGNTRNPYSKNNHPTVKPTDLMLYLIRLVTPKGGTTLDPFMGSGSSGKAATRGGFDFVGIEMDEEYMEIATARIQYEKDNPYNEEKGERVELNKNSQKFW
jgi:DNA modification methylase